MTGVHLKADALCHTPLEVVASLTFLGHDANVGLLFTLLGLK